MFLIDRAKLTPVGKLLVLLGAAWSLCTILPDYARLVTVYGVFGFDANNDAVVSDLDKPNSSPPIENNSVIDLRRTTRPNLAHLYAGAGGLQYGPLGQVTQLFLFNPASRTTISYEHTVRVKPYPLTMANKLALFCDQTLGLFFVLLATFLVWQKPTAMTLGFFLFSLWYNPGQAFVCYIFLEKYPNLLIAQEGLQALAQAAGYVGFAVFALRFPHDTVEGGWRQFIYKLLPIFFIYQLVLQLASFGTILGMHTEAVTTFAYMSGYIFDLCVVVLLLTGLSHQSPIDRQRTRWVLWGCIIGLPAFIFADSNESTSVWDPVWHSLGWTPNETVLDCFYMVNAWLALAVAYAVLRHRVIDVRLILRRAAARVIIWLAVGIALVECILMIEERIHELQTVAFVTMIITISLVFEWMHERINDRIDEMVFPRLHHAADRLERVDAAFGEVDNLDLADRLLIAEPAEALELASAAVFRLEEGGIYRQHVPGFGWPFPSECVITDSDTIIPELKRTRRALKLGNVAWHNALVPTDTRQPVVAIPIRRHSTLVAIALYGLHERGDDLEKREIDLLDKLCRSASSAYDKVEDEKLRQRISELEALTKPRPRRRAHEPKPATEGAG